MGLLSVGVSDHHRHICEESRSPSGSPDKTNSSPASTASSKRLHDIHIPSPDHAASVASSEHFEKSGLVAAQQAALHDSAILEMGYQMTESEYAFMPEGVTLEAPSIGSLKNLKALKAIRLRNLKVGKVHRGRILSGTLYCKSVKTSAVMNVLEEDGTGDATRIIVANAVPRSASTAQAQRLYPEGAQLSVCEPYLKRFSDGIVGLLVENPADVIFNYLPEELPSPEYEKEVFSNKPFLAAVNWSPPPEGEGQETHMSQAVDRSSSRGSSHPSHTPTSGKLATADGEEQSTFLAHSRDDGLLSTGISELAFSSEEGVVHHNLGDASPYDESGAITGEPLINSSPTESRERKTPSFSVRADECEKSVYKEREGTGEGVVVADEKEYAASVVVQGDDGSENCCSSADTPIDRGQDVSVGGGADRSILDERSSTEGEIATARIREEAVTAAVRSEESSAGHVGIPAAKVEFMAKVQEEREECSAHGQLHHVVNEDSVEHEKVSDVGSTSEDSTEAQIECIKVVVEESLEISLVAQVDCEKGMPENSQETPRANGGTKEGAESPTSETSVEKGIISVDSKTKGGATHATSDGFSAASLRLQGNKYFARQDWAGAIELYTQAILKAVQEFKENSPPHLYSKRADQPFSEEPESEVVMDYSNRAEAWLRLHHYERAWADAERALSLDPNHLKSLFRKGRALLGVGDYQQALAHLEAAYARAPFDKDLLAAIQLSRIGDHQSRLGIYDLTDYYLRGRFTGETLPCADYVGPVQVKFASGDKGRGLFLTKAAETGDLLLVSNPLAMIESKSGSKGRKNVLDSSAKGCLRFDPEVQEKLVHSVRERSKVSSKNRQKLLSLCHGEESMSVPSMDLFVPGRRIAPMEIPELDEQRIHRIVAHNVIDRNMVSTTMEKRHVFHREVSEDNFDDRCFYGLWLLPAFINHSCIPNVSMVVIGRSLFVYASRDLSAGEELLCSYCNVFQPLPQRREIASMCWGFSCKCARCLLETRFESSLKRLYSLHSRLEPNPTFVLQFSPFGYKAPAKDLAKELEIIENSKKLDNRERSWLQASFTQLYTVSRDFMGPHGNHPYLEAALRAMELVCPGSNSTLEVGLLARETVRKEFNGRKTAQFKAVNQQVLRICQCIYGKQKAAVLQSLVDGTPADLVRKP